MGRIDPDPGGSGEALLSGALDGLHEGLFVCDKLGRVAYANPALLRRLGPEREESVVGRHWGPLFEEESRRRIERDGLPTLLRDGRWRGPVALRGPAGATPGLTLSLSAGRGGGMTGLLAADPGVGDPAERLARAEARGQRLEALRRLAGDMTHELNNVLTSIVGYARFLTEDLPQDSQQHGFAQQIVVATRCAGRLIEDALAFARAGGGERRAVPVGPAVEQAAAAVRASLPAGSTLRVDGGGELAVEAEPAGFVAVLGHLLGNAAEALEGRPGTLDIGWRAVGDLRALPGLGGPGAPGRIALERQDGERWLAAAGSPDPNGRFLELTVRDSGAGMDEAVLEHVFEPFFTTRQPAKGRGLGLSAAFGQVVGHGGAILIDSAPGQGTGVTLLWPAAPVAEVRPDAPPAAAAAGAGRGGPPARRQLPRGRGERVLVAEDDWVLREALGEMLQRLGYRPVLVNDGEIARRLLAEGDAVEAVLTDRRMPNLSGTELIGWMRAAGLRQPVLLCTGYGEDLDGDDLSRAGGVSVLSKPVDAATLARSLAQSLTSPVG